MIEFFNDGMYTIKIKTKINPDYFYTTDELTAILGLSKPEKIMTWVRNGLVSHREIKRVNQFGGKYQILGKDVLEYLFFKFRYSEMLDLEIEE